MLLDDCNHKAGLTFVWSLLKSYNHFCLYKQDPWKFIQGENGETVLWKYFTSKEPTKQEAVEAILPKLEGPLSMLMPSSAIKTENSTVSEYLLSTKGSIKSPTCNEDEVQSSNIHGIYQIFGNTERSNTFKNTPRTCLHLWSIFGST